MHKWITVRGARVHNLKNVTVAFPRGQLIVVTGLSGSGKSSLAFDTLYAEGQRRYVESLSAYARQFLGQMDKPDVDSIEGLSPSISIDQKTTTRNPRSTVGTVTEIYDHLRLLFARVGDPHCPEHALLITAQTVQQIVDRVMALPVGSRSLIMAPVVRSKRGGHRKLLERVFKEGFVRARVDGEIYELDKVPVLDKQQQHTIEVIVDRVIVKPGLRDRITDSLETALRLADGEALVSVLDGDTLHFSQNFSCPICGFSLGELSPRIFSFNSPIGACERCDGLGTEENIDPALVFVENQPLTSGGIRGWPEKGVDAERLVHFLYGVLNIDFDYAEDLGEKQRDWLLYGYPLPMDIEKLNLPSYKDVVVPKSYKEGDRFEGVIHYLEQRYRGTKSQRVREQIKACFVERACHACEGARLRKSSLAVKVGGKSIHELVRMPLSDIYAFLSELKLPAQHEVVAGVICRELETRLRFLLRVGLDYLTLHRSAATLSGGEAQRIRLATQVGSGLTGVLYVLDEPSIGLHPRDNDRLLGTLQTMKDRGNTLVVVEHDEDTMRRADYLIDIGPGAGQSGGEVVAFGSPKEVMANKDSLTGAYLSGRRFIMLPQHRRVPKDWLTIMGACVHNLKDIDVSFPLRVLTCVTGVSGSGKSTLVNRVLSPIMNYHLKKDPYGVGFPNSERVTKGTCKGISGWEGLKRLVRIDQNPIGRTPRSNLATYTGIFDDIRTLFAETPDAKVRGYRASRFSFNLEGGRCEVCKGDGIRKIEMHFLPDVYVTCTECGGSRYNKDTLSVCYRGKRISDVLEMTVGEALTFFENHTKIRGRIEALADVGLSYIKIGQSATTLSGGEAQRLKLASELFRRTQQDATLYVLDEPTTGLHDEDVARLISVLHELVKLGGTVVVIEHNMDVIKTSDYIIDLGPEGGARGGQLIAKGTPEEVITVRNSHTGRFLKPIVEQTRKQMEGGHRLVPNASRFVGRVSSPDAVVAGPLPTGR